MKIKNWKQLILSYWPILLLVGVWFLFSSPYFVSSKVPFPSDYLVNNFAPWSAYPNFASPVKNAATPDVITQIFPWKTLVIESWKSGVIPLWNPYVFSGTPLLANYQSATLMPLNLIYLVIPFIDAWSIQILLQPLLAGIFMFMFIRALKISKEGALISALAFMFCGFITGWMVYGTLGYAILFLPLSLFLTERYYQTKKWYFLPLLSLTIPLSFFSGHFQTSLYFFVFIIAYICIKFWETKNFKLTLLPISFVFLGLLLSSPQLIPSMEFYNYAVRSATFLKTEIIPWSYLPTFLAPDYFGNSVTRNDWFGHYAEWNAYIGLIPFMLALYALKKRTKTVIFFQLTAFISFLLAFQTPIQDLLYALKVPVLSTSAASRVIVLFSFSAAVLAAFGFANLIEDIKEKRIKPLILWLSIFFVIFFLLWITTYAFIFFPEGKEIIARSNLKLPTLILGIFSLLIFIYILVSHFKIRIQNKLFALIPLVIILLVAFDVCRFATKWQVFQKKELVYPNVEINKFFENLEVPYRTFGNFGGEASMTYHLQTIEGYDPLYSKRYGEFLEFANKGSYRLPPRSAVFLEKKGKHASSVIDFLGVKYLVQKGADSGREWTFPIWDYPVNRFTEVYKDPYYTVFLNQGAIPRIFMVGEAKVETDGKKMLEAIFDKTTNLKEVVYLNTKPTLEIKKDSSSGASFKSYTQNKIDIETSSKENQILVLTDVYFPGWTAEIDGKSAKVLEADYAFRALEVPSGEHNITFTYNPNSFRIGIALFVLGAGVLAAFSYLGYKKKK